MQILTKIFFEDVELKEHDEIKIDLLTDWSIFKCILYHLISNALKHGCKGSVIELKLTVR